jgi:hypothetical protein
LDCHHYDSNWKPLEATAGKPFEPKMPYKKFGGDKSMASMQTIFKAHVKANKKAGNSKKRKKSNYDSSDSSDSEKKTGYGNTGFSVNRRLKKDKLLGTVYLSTEPFPIIVVDTAPFNNMKADEIVIETAKTGKVTRVVAAMSII